MLLVCNKWRIVFCLLLHISKVRDKQRLKVNVVRVPDKPLSAYKSSIPFETLQRYGFQRMMVDLIEAPEPVLCYFCEFQGLHQVPLGGDLNAVQIDRVCVCVCVCVCV